MTAPPSPTESATRHEIYDELDWKHFNLIDSSDDLKRHMSMDLPGRRRTHTLNETLELGSWANREPHYLSYSVYELQGERRSDLEGRVFLLESTDAEEVTPKQRKHRLRCIKRLASRAIHQVKVPKFHIIVFVRDPPVDESAEENKASPPVKTVRSGKEKPKTPSNESKVLKSSYQRISTKLRQRERRQAARKETREQAATVRRQGLKGSDEIPETGNCPDDAIIIDASGDVENFGILFVLYLAYDEQGEPRSEIPPDIKKIFPGMINTTALGVLQRYRDQRTLAFGGAEEVREFLDLKESELVFLRRLQKKMAGVDQHYKDKLLGVMHEPQARNGALSEQWREAQQSLEMFVKHRLMVVRHVAKALPWVIEGTEEARRELRAGLTLVRQREMEPRVEENEIDEGFLELYLQRHGLEKELEVMTSWLKGIVPLSPTHTDLEARRKVVEARLKSTKRAILLENERMSELEGSGNILSIRLK